MGRWTEADIAAARPFAELFPGMAKRISRGKQKAPTKVQVTLRLDRDVLAHYKAGGPGWQVRMGDALRKTAGL